MVNTHLSFYTEDELLGLGLGHVGMGVQLSRKVSLYKPQEIYLDDHCRIDDFCILSGNIKIGKYVHIAAYCGLFSGGTGIMMDDFSGLSSRCSLYAESDDYSGEFMINPTVPEHLRHVISAPIHMQRFSVVGVGGVLLPGATMKEGAVLAALSLLKETADAWKIYAGVPSVYKKERHKNIIELSRGIISE
jgi:acetyltransferase-like isoleucine patch superfamily enzyme